MVKMKKAMIFGVTGQDGSYLSEFLLDKGYQVIGITRRCSTDNTQRLKEIISPFFSVVEGELTDLTSVSDLIKEYQPDEVYNLAAQSHVGTSFKQPILTWKVNAEGAFNILEAVRQYYSHARVYQASTSEMFGSNVSNDKDGKEFFQDENTPFSPNSPYAIAKLAAHNAVRMYRDAYNLFACCGILFNHESPRRGEHFVTRKVTLHVAQLKHVIERNKYSYDNGYKYGITNLRLGNLNARRDWGHAKDYVRGMWMMLQQDKPDDFVLATGHTYSIKELLDCAFGHIGIDDWSELVTVDPQFYRPLEVEYLFGKPDKAKKVLGWKPEYDFNQLITEMVDNDYAQTQILSNKGHTREA